MLILCFTCLVSAYELQAQHVSGRIEASIVTGGSVESWQEKGIGATRFSGTALKWQQGVLVGDYRLSPNWQLKGVVNTYADGEEHLGFTQAYVDYKPLSANKIRFKARVGMFYPEMSVENTAKAWLSPYTYTQSAINSWIGEELRVFGGEVSWFTNGRKFRSPWSATFNMGTFKGNDPIGSLLTWRGWAMHDRQSLHHDKVQFADIPSVTNVDVFNSPTFVPVFSEIDGKWGSYAGLHIDYLRKTNIRYYIYNNRTNPNAINAQRIYAWRTKFHSLALEHVVNKNWRILSQMMTGSTLMGDNMVSADYTAAYLMASYKYQLHRTSVRIDYYDVDENDAHPQDPNNNHGVGITTAWRYAFSPNIELGAEYHFHKSNTDNRVLLGFNSKLSQTQLRLVASYLF
ncbi:MAG: hypothetical protein WA981_15920 [Glaciecola sp.]